MAISKFTELAQQPTSREKRAPSTFTQLAAATTPPPNPAPQPRGVLRTFAEAAPKKALDTTVKYVQDQGKKYRQSTLGERFISTFVEKPAQILNFATVDVPRYLAGGLSSVGKTVMEESLGRVVGKDYVRASFTPKTEAAKTANRTVFKDENPYSYQQIKEEVDAFTANAPEATAWEKAHLGTTLAVIGFAADAVPGKPGGKLTKTLVKELIKETDETMVTTMLKGSGVPDLVAERAGARVAAASTEKEVQNAIQAATREAFDDSTVKAVAPDPFKAKALTAETADEFVAAFSPARGGQVDEAAADFARNFARSVADDTAEVAVKSLDDQLEDGLRVLYRELKDEDALASLQKMQKENSARISAETRTAALAGKMENKRLVGDEMVTVFRATDQAGINDGDFVTTSRKNAEKYMSERDGARIVSQEVPKRDLIRAGLQNEYIVAPSTLSKARRSPEGSILTGESPASIGVQKDTPGLETLRALGKEPDPDLVDRAFAGQYTAGDGVSRTFDEIAEDTIVTSAEPTLAARVVSSLRDAKTNILEYVQNTEQRIMDLQKREDISFTDDSDIYLASTLYHGRLGNAVEKGREQVKDLFLQMRDLAKKEGTDFDTVRTQVNEYMWYRHAIERNAYLGDGAAGIKTADAEKRLADLRGSVDEPNARFSEVERIADEFTAMNRTALTTLRDAQVITPELFETLTERYQNYVPLNRIMDFTTDMADALSGKGMDVKSSGIKRAKGSDRAVADIVENTIVNFEQAMIRSEKNLVDLATYRFVEENAEALKGSMKIKKPRVGDTTQDPKILQMFKDGKRAWVEIADEDLATAIRGTGRQNLPQALQLIASYTRLMSGLATRFNPEFAAPNIIRDIQERTLYLAANKDFKGKGAFGALKNDPASVKGVIDFLRKADTPEAKLYAEMKENGGTTGGMGLSTRKMAQMNIRHFEQLAKGHPRLYAEKMMEYVDNWNTVFEDATRLTTYKSALEQGLSPKQAAFLAKEATVNFNRMGKAGPVVNGLFMFANASIQGSVKTIRALKNPKVLAGVTAIVGTAVYAMNEWNDSVDPEWRSKVSEWDQINSLTVMLPSTDGSVKHIAVPVSWGLKPIKVAADYAYRLGTSEDVTVTEMTEAVLTAILESYNPVGGTDLMSAVTPTVLDLPLDLARNQKWSGSVIKPDYDPYAPESIKYFDSLEEKTSGQVAISLTQKLAGWGVEISPADITYAAEQLVGGAGRFTEKIIDTINKGTKGEVPAMSDFPFISRFYREKGEDEIFQASTESNLKELWGEDRREKFYEKKKAQDFWNTVAELPAEEQKTRLKDLARSDEALFERVLDIAESEKQGLVGEERQLKEAPVAVRAQVIAGKLKKLKDKEAKKAYLEDLASKKILTDSVLDELFIVMGKSDPTKQSTGDEFEEE